MGNRRGNSLIEFTLVGIPLIFVLISIFEMARWAWTYHTLAYSMKEGVRYAIVHGTNCSIAPNSCYVTIRDISRKIADAGVGLDLSLLTNVTFTSATRTLTCSTLQACLAGGSAGSTVWPALPPGSTGYPDEGGNAGSEIRITAQYPFSSAISMLWPGAKGSVVFGTYTFPASSSEGIQY
ncbi:MAG: TadE/TadG family type IV pilus assembly protein [Acidobacteriota bacterium]